MNTLRLLALVSLFALGTAEAVGDESRMETIVVTAKRPAVIQTDETIVVRPVIAADSLARQLVIVPPRLDYLELPPVPTRSALAQVKVINTKG